MDPDRRAWHRAEAANGPDDLVADELERSARRARGRGGLAAAATFLARAAALTSDSSRKVERVLAASEAKAVAGAWEEALTSLAGLMGRPLDDLQAARADLVRAQVSQAQSDGVGAPALFLSAAGRLRDLDPPRAQIAYLDALGEAVRGQVRGEVDRVAGAVAPAELCDGTSPVGMIMTGWVRLTLNGYPDGVDLLTRATQAFLAQEQTDEGDLRGLWFACRAAYTGWDYEAYYALCSRYLDVTRRAGALSALPRALQTWANALIYAGDLAGARAAIEEAKSISEATGSAFGPARDLGLVGLSAPADRAFDQIDAVRREAVAKGDLRPAQKADRVTAVLCNSLSRYEEAVVAAERYNGNHPQGGGAKVWAEQIEAYARAGQPGLAAKNLDRLSERMKRAGTDWALGVEARSQALVAAPDAAEARYLEAIERFGRARVRLHLARTHLVYGEWLRREGRRTDARVQLASALDFFESVGAPNFAERARTELAAAGERAPKTARSSVPELTPQEAQVARLASEGMSNQEIAARLFLSAHTVDFHLRKVFRKFGITSRAQLHGSLPSTASI
jgi:DNA-binding CsgD family transcriptional regulator